MSDELLQARVPQTLTWTITFPGMLTHLSDWQVGKRRADVIHGLLLQTGRSGERQVTGSVKNASEWLLRQSFTPPAWNARGKNSSIKKRRKKGVEQLVQYRISLIQLRDCEVAFKDIMLAARPHNKPPRPALVPEKKKHSGWLRRSLPVAFLI